MKPLFVAIDWGTSHFRGFVVGDAENSPTGSIFDSLTTTKGVARIDSGSFESYLLQQLEKLQHDGCPIMLCGMVGSSIGWKDVGYLECPANAMDFKDHLRTFECAGTQAVIVPGLKCISPTQNSDVMRGEETQILGWLTAASESDKQDALLCLPGTHTKWVRIKNGVIVNFHTSLTGELFDLLLNGSVLIEGEQEDDLDAFNEGLSQISTQPEHLSHLLFTVRSRVVADKNPANNAAAYLSGLLIGSDIASALKLHPVHHVAIIGAPRLSRYYEIALKSKGCRVDTNPGDTLVVSGLEHLYGAVF